MIERINNATTVEELAEIRSLLIRAKDRISAQARATTGDEQRRKRNAFDAANRMLNFCNRKLHRMNDAKSASLAEHELIALKREIRHYLGDQIALELIERAQIIARNRTGEPLKVG